MNKLEISPKEQKIDSVLLISAGAVIGVIALMAEGRILSDPSNLEAALKMGENVVAGFGFAGFGAVKLRRQLRKPK